MPLIYIVKILQELGYARRGQLEKQYINIHQHHLAQLGVSVASQLINALKAHEFGSYRALAQLPGLSVCSTQSEKEQLRSSVICWRGRNDRP